MDVTSLSLLERLRRRDDEPAWSRFDHLYRPLIARWLAQAGVPAHEAEDLAQEVMLVVVRKMEHFEHTGRPGAFRAWLRNITAFSLRERWRGRQRRGETRTPLGDLADQLDDPHSDLSQRWDRDHDGLVLHRLLDLLAGEFEAVTLQVFRRLALDEAKPDAVAQEFGLSPGAVYVAKSRVMRRLREEAEGLLADPL
jgi:RNA polymerase sigma-70 factor (ECF subfamily)